MARGKPLARILLLAALVAAGLAASSVVQAEPAEPNGAQLVEQCRAQADSPLCRQVEQLTRNGAQVCRLGGLPENVCSAADGREYSEAAVAEFEESGVGEALRLQARLDDGLPVGEALLPATHNSYNSAAYLPTVSGLDHNQVMSMGDQLRVGMRSLELDIHWFPSPFGDPADGGFAPILCHGQTEAAGPVTVHVGCSAERHLRDGLAEVATWLDANPDDFLLLYLENHLDGDPAAHAAAAATIAETLGEAVYPTAGGTCDPLPGDLSQLDVFDAGARVLLVGNPAPGNTGPWCELVHDRFGGVYAWAESKSGVGDDFDCEADRAGHDYRSTFRRFYEDSTWLGATLEFSGQASPGEITADETAAMVACGVTLFGFDQLVPADPRLEALVWSWAADEPSTGHVAYRGTDGRFRATGDDAAPRPHACLDPSGGWVVTAAGGPWSDGPAACAAHGATFSVPHTGFENTLLPTTTEVWVNYATVGGEWTPDVEPSGAGAGSVGLVRARETPAGAHLPSRR